MNSRDTILKRLRETKIDKKSAVPSTLNDNQLFKDFPISKDRLYEYFRNRFVDLKGEFYPVSSSKQAANIVHKLLRKMPGKTCLVQKSTFLEEVFSKSVDINNLLIEDPSINSHDLAEYDIGVTGADFLVARTGSILLRSISGGGRRLSILPPIHIVIANEEQIVSSIDETLHSYSQCKEPWSFATMITGASRTSDIEKQLVLGAHGPKRLVVILIRRSS